MSNYPRRIHKTMFLEFTSGKPLQQQRMIIFKNMPPFLFQKGEGGAPGLGTLGITCWASEMNSFSDAQSKQRLPYYEVRDLKTHWKSERDARAEQRGDFYIRTGHLLSRRLLCELISQGSLIKMEYQVK